MRYMGNHLQSKERPLLSGISLLLKGGHAQQPDGKTLQPQPETRELPAPLPQARPWAATAPLSMEQVLSETVQGMEERQSSCIKP